MIIKEMKPKRLTRYLSSKVKGKIKNYSHQVVHGWLNSSLLIHPYTHILGKPMTNKATFSVTGILGKMTSQ